MFLFQVIAERAENVTVILITNPALFRVDSGDSQCAPLQGPADRNTDRAHILETGAESYRFRRTVEKGRANGLIAARAGLRLRRWITTGDAP